MSLNRHNILCETFHVIAVYTYIKRFFDSIFGYFISLFFCSGYSIRIVFQYKIGLLFIQKLYCNKRDYMKFYLNFLKRPVLNVKLPPLKYKLVQLHFRTTSKHFLVGSQYGELALVSPNRKRQALDIKFHRLLEIALDTNGLATNHKFFHANHHSRCNIYSIIFEYLKGFSRQVNDLHKLFLLHNLV